MDIKNNYTPTDATRIDELQAEVKRLRRSLRYSWVYTIFFYVFWIVLLFSGIPKLERRLDRLETATQPGCELKERNKQSDKHANDDKGFLERIIDTACFIE